MQRQHARRGRPAERRDHAEARLGFGQQRVVAAGKARAHLAIGARPRLRGDRGRACGAPVSRSAVAPGRAARGHEIGLRAQDGAVVDDLQAVGGERRAGGGDVDDQLGGARRRRAFGRARAFDDAVIDDAVGGEEIARQVHVFGRDPHLAVVAQPERGRDVVEIGHAAHVDPGLRHRDHDIGEAEAEPLDHHHALLDVGDHLAQQILAGDAEMDGALRQLRRRSRRPTDTRPRRRAGRRSRRDSRARRAA